MFEFNNTVTLEFMGRNLLVPKMDKLPEESQRESQYQLPSFTQSSAHLPPRLTDAFLLLVKAHFLSGFEGPPHSTPPKGLKVGSGHAMMCVQGAPWLP